MPRHRGCQRRHTPPCVYLLLLLPLLLQVVVDQLRALLEQDLAFMASVLDCISNMTLEQHLQVRSKAWFKARVPSNAEDLTAKMVLCAEQSAAGSACSCMFLDTQPRKLGAASTAVCFASGRDVSCRLLQDHVLSMLLGQLAAVEVEDLPALVKYLLGSATKANAEQASTWRNTDADPACGSHTSAVRRCISWSTLAQRAQTFAG